MDPHVRRFLRVSFVALRYLVFGNNKKAEECSMLSASTLNERLPKLFSGVGSKLTKPLKTSP